MLDRARQTRAQFPTAPQPAVTDSVADFVAMEARIQADGRLRMLCYDVMMDNRCA